MVVAPGLVLDYLNSDSPRYNDFTQSTSMRRHFCLIALFLPSLVFSAQPLFKPQNAQGAPPEFIYKLEGTVVNAQTGQPIPRALVELFTSGRQVVLTGP